MRLTHLEFDATNPFMRHWFDAMGERGRYVRYDAWGAAPSEPAPAEISFDRWADDSRPLRHRSVTTRSTYSGSRKGQRLRSGSRSAAPGESPG
jgi:hypothetical protein